MVDASPNAINWKISAPVQDSNGPNTDYLNSTEGHFLYVVPDSQTGLAVAEIETPMYRNSNTECMLSFYLYISSPENNNIVYPMMKHIALGMSSELDRLDLTVMENGLWTKVDIGLGRHRDIFSLAFTVVHESQPYNAGIAIDDISFFDCALPSPQETCEEYHFHCEINKACVMNSLKCDLTDDCGDYTDEALAECSNYIKIDFEDFANPFGFFVQDHSDADFEWSRGNGTTINKFTGPPFDHTTFEPEGHFLYIESSIQERGAKAILSTPLFEPSTQECEIRLFIHLHGRGIGNLTIYEM